MHTDTIFYQIFLTFHTLLFELLGQPTENAQGYNFTSVEVKEKAFRFDGIFKFSKLTRQEIEAMFLVSDIKQTRVYQEAKQEEATNLLIRMLSKRFGKLTNSYIEYINSLTIAQLEDMGEALLDFVDITDLDEWLKSHT